MRRPWIGALLVAACSSNNGNHMGDGGPTFKDAAVDAPPDAPVCVPFAPATCAPTAPPTTPATGSATCDPLAQTGCTTGQKCTWIDDGGAGHDGCVPVGDVATECPCSTGSAGPTGYDDCVAGSYCGGGLCQAICSQGSGSAACDERHACELTSGLFGETDGLCARRCDPLGENDFLGSGNKYQCACGSGQGCYGVQSATDGEPTAYTCSKEVNPTLVHRSECTTADNCAADSESVYLNGCAQGYEPLLLESTTSSTVVCVALCRPGNTYQGNPGTQYPAGRSPHACNTTDARGTFNTATTTTNGDHCAYSWFLELDDSGTLVRSPTSDTVGFCFDHTKYMYDSNGDGTPDTVIPACADLPLMGSGSAVGAVDFGCVDSVTAGMPRHPALRGRWLGRPR